MTIIDFWHDRHPEACAHCQGRALKWSPDRDLGVLVYDGRRLVEDSALARRLLAP